MLDNLTTYEWRPADWQQRPARQLPVYPCTQTLSTVLSQLSEYPPLVDFVEVDRLKTKLAEAARGECFILQGGDCAEHFQDSRADIVTKKQLLLEQMQQILSQTSQKKILTIARMAGQYAKPRTYAFETRDDITLPSYRGDLINSAAFSQIDRLPDPYRMLTGHACAQQTLKYLKTREHGFYVSHEALLLPFEEALTRRHPETAKWYNLSTHFPWIGMRTAVLKEAHIEYLRGIKNPVGVKIGVAMTPSNIAALVRQLNPQNEVGRLVLIHRLGLKHIKQLLPQLLRCVKNTGIQVIWMCDPMHGNTFITKNGFKTRHFTDILSEFSTALSIHREYNIPLSGIHCEMTHDSVTECMGGEMEISEQDLRRRYKTMVDPRLDPLQALELAYKVGEMLG